MAFPKIDKSKLDDMHFDKYARKLLSFNKPKVVALSPRELGKSTWWWLYAYEQCVYNGYTSILLKYFQADVLDVTIGDIEDLISKFTYQPVKLKYKRGSLKDGVVDVELFDEEENITKPFFRIVVINLQLRRLKSLFYKNLRWMVFDEYMLDTRSANESYPKNLTFKLNEIFATFNRECDGKLRLLCLGNPYSKFCPLHNFIGFNSQELQIDKILVGDDYVATVQSLPQKLIDHIKERDKNYKFDETYMMYKIFGQALNDTQIRIKEKVTNYTLRYVFYIENHKVLVYFNNNFETECNNMYWICIDDNYKSERKDIITFDYNSLIDGTILIGKQEKAYFTRLILCYRHRKIEFQNVEASYLFEQIYDCISV